MLIAFFPVVKNPNGYLLGNSPDAIKNYYNVAYFVKHGQGWDHRGVNHPEGESLLYLDTQPIIAKTIHWINGIIPLENHVVGILNLLMLFSFPVCTLFLFWILRSFEQSPWLACIFALCITFLSPQLDRIHGHYALSYAVLFVAALYCWIRFLNSDNTWNWWGFAGASIAIFSGFVHPYHLAIYSVFFVALSFIVWIVGKYSIARIMAMFMFSIFPLLIFFLFHGLIDDVHDRPIDPYGFFVFHADLFSVFLPDEGSFAKLIRYIFNPDYEWEGRAFTGTVPLLLTGLFVLYIFRHWKERNDIVQNGLPFLLGSFLVAGIISLFFAFGIPLRWMEWLVDLLSPVKQFRSLGRFAWPFYYTFALTGAYLLSQYLRNSSEDKLIFNRGHSAMVEAMKCSYHTGLPLLHAVGPRNSLSESLNNIQLLSSPGIPKGQLDSLDSRPILLLSTSEIKTPQESDLIDNSSLIWEDEYISLHSLPISAFHEQRAKFEEEYHAIKQGLDCVRKICISTDHPVHFLSFDSTGFAGVDSTDGLYLRKAEDHVVFSGELPATDYLFSAWLKIDLRKHGMPRIKYAATGVDGQTEGSTELDTRTIYDVYDGWARIEWSWTVDHPGLNHEFSVSGDYITIDHLIVRPSGSDILVKAGDITWFNGFPVH